MKHILLMAFAVLIPNVLDHPTEAADVRSDHNGILRYRDVWYDAKDLTGMSETDALMQLSAIDAKQDLSITCPDEPNSLPYPMTRSLGGIHWNNVSPRQYYDNLLSSIVHWFVIARAYEHMIEKYPLAYSPWTDPVYADTIVKAHAIAWNERMATVRLLMGDDPKLATARPGQQCVNAIAVRARTVAPWMVNGEVAPWAKDYLLQCFGPWHIMQYAKEHKERVKGEHQRAWGVYRAVIVEGYRPSLHDAIDAFIDDIISSDGEVAGDAIMRFQTAADALGAKLRLDLYEESLQGLANHIGIAAGDIQGTRLVAGSMNANGVGSAVRLVTDKPLRAPEADSIRPGRGLYGRAVSMIFVPSLEAVLNEVHVRPNIKKPTLESTTPLLGGALFPKRIGRHSLPGPPSFDELEGVGQ